MALQITSSAFADGEPIPTKHSCDGEDVSPPLSWEDAPEGTVSFALICDDPDAPVGTWVHWVIYGIPAGSREIPTSALTPSGAKQGINDFKRIGYGGPCPPPGPAHRYFFKLYALDSGLELDEGATKGDLLGAMEGHILAEAHSWAPISGSNWRTAFLTPKEPADAGARMFAGGSPTIVLGPPTSDAFEISHADPRRGRTSA